MDNLGQSLEHIPSEKQENEFMKWLIDQKNLKEGKGYSERSVLSFVRDLKKIYANFGFGKFENFNSIFQIQDVSTFSRFLSYLEGLQEFNKFVEDESTGTTNQYANALDWYKKFLMRVNRPYNMPVYEERDLKLAIKSSLPRAKSTVALAILLWEVSGHPAELEYSTQDEDKIVLTSQLEKRIIEYLSDICEEGAIESDDLIEKINNNQLFQAQIESLIVAFELFWKLAKVDFVDESKSYSAERTGEIRFPKKLTYSTNMDIIHTVINNDMAAYCRILLFWLGGYNTGADREKEKNLEHLLTIFSESAVFKLVDGTRDVIFNQNSIYRKLLDTSGAVDINGDQEPRGPLRILKSAMSENINPYLQYSWGNVKNAVPKEELANYQERVDTFLRLCTTKIIGRDSLNVGAENIGPGESEALSSSGGTNILLYGVPGSGKSWTIEHEYCTTGCKVERLVFHPDYTYSDFVGQILPAVAEDGQVSYEFTPGPFTNILKEAHLNPEEEYILVIEEINRGNAPAIFGEIFQLLDRKIEGSNSAGEELPPGASEYGISNPDIAKVVYGDPAHKVRIPSNLTIIATMNTSDQNVFTLDTAFQRRWDMRLIENSFENVDPAFANAEILDTGITWKNFCVAINNIVVGNNIRLTSTEDKRLGVYFVHAGDLRKDDRMGNLSDGEYAGLLKKESIGEITADEKARLQEIRTAMKQYRKFPEKVIKYLWDDAFKFNREMVFETGEYQSLEQVIRAFMYAQGIDRFKMFKEDVINAFKNYGQ